MKFLLTILVLHTGWYCFSQQAYIDSLLSFREKYIEEHEVVKGEGGKLLQFYPPDKQYCITAHFEKIQHAGWFEMQTSGNEKQTYRPFGFLYFAIKNIAYKLNIYQSKDLLLTTQYADYLFVPFTDSTNGGETYESGRYIDLRLSDIKNNHILLDFNKAYNPYCAYVKNVFNCPLPPAENHLPLLIIAGEKKYKKEDGY